MTLEQIVMDEDYPECHRLHSAAGISELYQVTDVKGQKIKIFFFQCISKILIYDTESYCRVVYDV